jgi:hypothetical protein
MKKVFLLFLVVYTMVTACNSGPDKKADVMAPREDTITVETEENLLPEKQLAIINETGISKYARQSHPDLNWNKFLVTKFWQEDFKHRSAFNPEESFFDVYGPFLKYSPDSTKFIDLDSYNVSISRAANGRLTGSYQGPDTEINLIDLKTKEKVSLLFLGPGNSIEDAAWIDNNNLILIGYLENDSASGTNAAIWQFNLSSKNVNLYELADTAVLSTLKNYSEKVRLKNVLIR